MYSVWGRNMAKHNALFKALDELHILIIEDNMSMIKIYKNILASFGVKQVSFSTTMEYAQELVKTDTPDLIICDFILDGTNMLNSGLAFLKWLRQVEHAPNCYIPVLMATGHASRRVILEFNKYGATSVVVKPLSPTILKQRLNSILGDTRNHIVTAGRVSIEGAISHTKPKKRDRLVYDPGFLSRMVKNNENNNKLEQKPNKIELLVEEEDAFDMAFKSQYL